MVAMITLMAGCNDGGLSSRRDSAMPIDGHAGEASLALDSRPADTLPTNDVADVAGADTADTATSDSGTALDVTDTPTVGHDTLADAAPVLIDGSPSRDGATTVDGEDSGRLGPSSVEVGAPQLDGPSDTEVEPDGPALPRDQADAWACNAPACWTDLMADCQPSGACRQRVSGETSNRCYANGVKVLATVHGTATMTTTVKNSTKTCFEMVFDMTGGTSAGFIKDGNGATVATIADAPSGRSTVACLGHDPVVLNEACDSLPWVAGACESGDCNP
jgi:hypothetical protein